MDAPKKVPPFLGARMPKTRSVLVFGMDAKEGASFFGDMHAKKKEPPFLGGMHAPPKGASSFFGMHAQKKEPPNAMAERSVDDVRFNHEVFINKLGRVYVIGMNAPYLCCRENHMIWFFLAKEYFHCILIGKIKLFMCSSNQVCETF